MAKSIFIKWALVLLFIATQVVQLTAQTKDELETKAYGFLNDGAYADAYTAFDALVTKYPKELDYKQKLGICCLKYPEKKERAIDIFLKYKESKIFDADYYLGKAYHVNSKFNEAKPFLNAFIQQESKNNKKEVKELVDDAELVLKNCDNGIMLINNKVIANIKNMGPTINTDANEYVPAISTDEALMIFTYSGKKSMGGKLNTSLQPDAIEGKYLEDIYITRQSADSVWGDPASVSAVNTNGNESAVSVSADGRTLFTFFSTDKNEGDIYVSVLDGQFSKPKALNKNINSEFWEGSCSISADGKYLYFASERPGGFGGRDLYISEKINGDWGPAKNMGPEINTKYDDDAPFIHPDGITLFFSSKGHQSIGGYDIMFSVKKENTWLAPKSMGLPLNTTEDDRYYVINSRGDKGYFSSNRVGGFGGQDIYSVAPGILGDKPVIALLKGVVYGDDKPIEAKIEVIKTAQKEAIGPFESNKENGKYLMALSPGFIYRIKVNAEGFEPVEEDLDIENLNKYMETNKDFYLYKAGSTKIDTTKTNPIKTATTSIVNNSPCGTQALPDFSQLKGKSLNNSEVYKQLLSTAGNYCAKNLIFSVQIAAYRKPENYKYNHLKQYGEPKVVNYPDGITRFTQLEFTTIKDAEAQRQKTIAKGQTDAWIVGFVDGKRYTLEELIMQDFFGKAIN